MDLSEAQDALLDLFEKHGCIYEDDYRDIAFKMNAKDDYDLNMWVLSTNLPLRKNKPRTRTPSEYQEKVKQMVKHPDARKLLKKKKSSVNHIAKAVRMLRQGQRIDEEKRMLEDTIRSRQSQIPDWKSWLDKVKKALDFSELRDLWEQMKSIPAFACLYGDRDLNNLFTT